MTSSYSRNIANLRERSRKNTNDRIQQDRELTEIYNRRGQQEAVQISRTLGQFSTTLNDLAEERIKDLQVEGKRIAREHAQADAERMYELAKQIESHKGDHTELTLMKEELLKLQGTSAYPEADRLTSLSGWQQVGYAQEKLRAWKETLPDKLAWTMQNSEKPITIQGITFTPKQLRENNIQGLPFKEAAIKVATADIRKAANLDMYSEEMLELAGVGDAINKAQEGLMAKYRQRYNIDSSFNTRSQWVKEWNRIPEAERTGEDLWRGLLISGNTVGPNGQILGNVGGWKFLMDTLKAEGIRTMDSGLADRMGNLPLPEGLRIKVGAKPGTTFAQQWPGRFATLKAEIRNGRTEALNQELKNQNSVGTDLEIKFKEAANQATLEGRTISTRELNWWKGQFANHGLDIPSDIKNYETASARNQRQDKKAIQAQLAINDYITHAELDAMHPLAAAEFRDKADAYEKEILEKFDAKGIIKGAMDSNFDDMGYKDKEKSDVYRIAINQAERDYQKQYNEYIGMGIPAETAHWWALKGPPPDLKNNEGQPLFGGRLGVLTEIRQNGEKSKYVQEGLFIEKTVGTDLVRARYIFTGKTEMLEQPDLRETGIIGGEYGQKQLDAIIKNIKDYGLYRGIALSKEHTQYYKGLMQGRSLREGGWWGLLHDQLVVAGHPGLYQNTPVTSIYQLQTGKVQNPEGEDEKIEDNEGVREVSSRGFNAGNNGATLLAYNYISDASNFHNRTRTTSVFDDPDQIPSYLGGTA